MLSPSHFGGAVRGYTSKYVLRALVDSVGADTPIIVNASK